MGFVGTSATDTLQGTDGPNTIKGRGGADTLNGRGGSDTLEGESGGQTLFGGEGDDILKAQAGPDTLLGGGGHDTLSGGTEADVLNGGPGADVIDGDQGADTLDYADRSTAVSVDLSAVGTAGNGGVIDDLDGAGPSTTQDLVSDLEHVRGGAVDDTIVGNDVPNTLTGGGGADQITGGRGIDTFDGGTGADVIAARDGFAEPVTCGDGVDTAAIDEIDVLTGCENAQLMGPAYENGGPTVTGETGGGTTGNGTEQTGGPSTENRPRTTPPLPRLGSALAPTFRNRASKTVVTRLRLNGAVAGTTVRITCAAPKKGACPFKTRTVQVKKAARRLDLTKSVGKKPFGKGAVLDVRVTGTGWVGVGTRYTFRSGAKTPLAQTLTL